MKNILLLSCLAFFAACKPSKNENIETFFKEIYIPANANIGLLNPDFCGSCTDYSINWLAKCKTDSNKKIILSTGKLSDEYKTILKKAGYSFYYTDQEKIARLGIPLIACTYIRLEDGTITEFKTVKN